MLEQGVIDPPAQVFEASEVRDYLVGLALDEGSRSIYRTGGALPAQGRFAPICEPVLD